MTPSVHLFSQSRGKLRWDDALQGYVPGTSAERERSAGACRGIFGLHAALSDGYAQGEAAAQAAGCRKSASRAFAVSAIEPAPRRHAGASPAAHRARQPAFVDFQNDVTTKDLALAVREGFRSVEHVKRYTTTGMATDQGKTSNMNALAVLSQVTGAPVPEIGLTTFRKPYTPVTFGTLAGLARRRSVRSGAAHADPRLGRGARCGLRGCRVMEACALFPARRRDHARCREARMRGGAPVRRPVRRLDARQDRDRRPRRRRVSRPHVRQFVEQPCAGPPALRRHAARGRLRDGRRCRGAPRR